MWRAFQALFMTIALASGAPSQAQVIYELRSFADTFVIEAPGGFITADSTFLNPSNCLFSGAYACTQVDFFVDAFAAGLVGMQYGWQAIAVTAVPGTAYYYFEAGSFTSFGHYESVAGAASDAVLLLVPEIAPAQAMAIGLPVLALLVSRRRQRSRAGES